jgi:hypothetical protein
MKISIGTYEATIYPEGDGFTGAISLGCKHSASCGALPVSRVGLGGGCGHVCCDCGRCGS